MDQNVGRLRNGQTPFQISGKGRPGWHLSSARSFSLRRSQSFSDGRFKCLLACAGLSSLPLVSWSAWRL